MGLCLQKQCKQCSREGDAVKTRTGSSCYEGIFAVSLDRAKAKASNAATVAARYHSSGYGGRHLSEDYEISEHVLGEGLSGAVVMAKGRRDRRKYALKRIQKRRAKDVKQLVAEVEIYLALDHPHIAALRDVYETDSEIALLTECCEGGELYARLSSLGTYAESDAVEVTKQMLLAVGYLHAHDVVHRDLKLENFLYESNEDNATLKLIDFGFAKVWDSTTLMMASCGSIAYVSPDVLSGRGYTSKCDLWSLGVIVFMLVAGYPPFHGNEKEMRANIVAAQVDFNHKSRWKGVSRNARDFINALLVKDPLERMDAKQALRHRWLTAGKSAGSQPLLSKDALRSLKRYGDTSRVKRAVLQLLAQELEPNETKELREVFLSIDGTGEGTITLGELKNAIRGTRDSPKTPKAFGEAKTPKTPGRQLQRAKTEVIGHLFDVLSNNGDEQIYYSDFLAATMDVRSQLRQENLRAAFHRLDADDSGTIGTEDLRRVLGDTFEGVDVEQLIEEADLTGTGEVGFQSFVRLLEDCDATPKTPAAQRARPGHPVPLSTLQTAESLMSTIPSNETVE